MIVCRSCGNHNRDDAEFCASCRTYLAWEGERTPAQQPAVPAPGVPITPGGSTAPGPPSIPDNARATTLESPRPPGSETVTVAPMPPAAVQPAAERHAPPPIVAEARPHQREHALYCSACGSDNDPERTLCRSCGAPLARPTPVRPPWWRRIFRRSALPAAGERPGRRRRGRARRGRRAVRATVGLALLGAVAVLVFPARGAVTSGYKSIKAKFTTVYDRVNAVKAEASTSAKNHDPGKAIDGVRTTSWAEGIPGEGNQQWLTIRLARKADLAQVGITPGASDREKDFRATSRPREIRLLFSNRTEQTITLKDEPTFQTFPVAAKGVDWVRFDLLSAYPGQTRLNQTSIAEVEFFKKR